MVNIFLSIDPGFELSRTFLNWPSTEGIRLNTGAPITGTKIDILKADLKFL